MSGCRIAAILPARMRSSRFPGKPLLDFHGLPMIEHVRRRVLMAGVFTDVVVATCDDVIADAVNKYGGDVIMTAVTHEAATDRVAEAMGQLDCTHVVNVQGDEVLILPDDLRNLSNAIVENPAIQAWNAIAPIESAEELKDLSIVKCVVSLSNRILFCARDFSRVAPRNSGLEPVHRILGILAFSAEFLGRYPKLSRTPIETAESIDQSRIIEHDIDLRGVLFSRGYPGINEPREVALVEEFLRYDARQRKVMEEILTL
jgi:3-deoxy-manno-octulosonate cytidylyltransferase (CMP-KDO synthetase)